MAALPYMPLYVADYLADTAHLGAVEHGAYLMLIMNYWQRGKPLPADDLRLARIARVEAAQWPAVRDQIAEFFTEEDGEWRHKRVDAELARVAEKSEKAKASAQRPRSERSANAKRPPSDGEANDERPPSYTDTDTKQEKKERGSAPSGAAPPDLENSGKAKATTLDRDWHPSDADVAHGKGLGLTDDDIDRAVSRFKNHHCDSPARRSDWSPAFRNWCEEDARKRGKRPDRPPDHTPVATVWVPENSEAWAKLTAKRGKPPIKHHSPQGNGAYVRASELEAVA